MKKILYFAMWVVLVLTFLVIAYVSYLAVIPVKVFEINSIHMTTPKVKVGQDAIYRVSFCRQYDGPIHVFKSIDGPSLIYVPEAINNNAAGCAIADVSVNIPSYALPGTYVIKVVAEAEVNPVKKVTVRFQTDSFEVTE